MKYCTTRDNTYSVSLREAIFAGLGPDSALFVPRIFPRINPKNLVGKSIHSIATQLLLPFVVHEIEENKLEKIISKALTFEIPINNIHDAYILELFHGPTASFKDIASQILGSLMEEYLKNSKRNITIITATSGDTGGAVASGFANKENIKVYILYPKNGVSHVQESQLTHVAENIYPIEVDGSFDDCQKYVKQLFSDKRVSSLNITSANSINIGRLLPQMIYYAFAWSKLRTDNIRFVVPSGNMGNITAGLYAKQIGLPIRSFHIACNRNDPVVKYFRSRKFIPQKSVKTISNAMDIGNPSNFERILHLYDDDFERISHDVSASSTDDTTTISVIKSVYKEHNYLLDPHTAVAWNAHMKTRSDDMLDIIIATASPRKFSDELRPFVHKDTFSDFPFEESSYSKRIFPVSNNYEEIVDRVHNTT